MFSVFSTMARRIPYITLVLLRCDSSLAWRGVFSSLERLRTFFMLSRNRGAVSLFWFLPSHGQVFLLGLDCLLQAISDSKPFTKSLDTSISGLPDLGFPLLIGGLA